MGGVCSGDQFVILSAHLVAVDVGGIRGGGADSMGRCAPSLAGMDDQYGLFNSALLALGYLATAGINERRQPRSSVLPLAPGN